MNIKSFLYISSLFIITNNVIATEDIERIEYDSSTGNYVIWENIDGVPTPNTFTPATKVSTHTTVKMLDAGEVITYKYTTKNLSSSQQDVESILIKAKSVNSVDIDADDWISKINTDASTSSIGIVYWGDEMGGVSPGNSLSYNVSSSSLPGISSSYIQGATPIMSFHGYGVGPELEEEYQKLTNPENNSVKHFIIAPMILVNDRHNPVDVLAGMIQHAKTLRDGNTIDKTLADTVIRYLEASFNAASRKNRSGLMQNLAEVTQVLSTIKSHQEAYYKKDVTMMFASAYKFNINYLHKRLFSHRNVNENNM